MTVKYIKWHSNIPKGHKMYQHFPFQGPPKYVYPNWDFLYENKPSGNPVCGRTMAVRPEVSLKKIASHLFVKTVFAEMMTSD
jgi:hypothetical protein